MTKEWILPEVKAEIDAIRNKIIKYLNWFLMRRMKHFKIFIPTCLYVVFSILSFYIIELCNFRGNTFNGVIGTINYVTGQWIHK